MNPCGSSTAAAKVATGGVVGLMVMLIAPAAIADQFDTVNFTTTAGYQFDSNIYRLPSSVDPQLAIGAPGKSDRIRQVSLSIDVDKKYANQEFLFAAKGTNNKYRTFSSLDHNATAYNAAWYWSPGSKLHGTLSYNRTQTLYSFADVRTDARNLKTERNPRLTADWWFQSDWHLLLGAAGSDSTSSVTTANSLSYRTRTEEWGLKHTSSGKTSVTLMSRIIRGTYGNTTPDFAEQIDTGYTERQQELQASWQITGKSALNGNLRNLKRRYPVLSQRDYSGTERGINYAWSATGKTYLNMGINRSVSSWFAAESSYYVTDTASLSTGWQASPRINMHVTLLHGKTDYHNPVSAGALERNDVNQSQEFGVGWAPDQSLNFNVSLQHARRTSNYEAFEYSDKSANIFLLVTF